MVIDVLERGDLPFPRSLPEFQHLFPDEAACAAYLERARWGDGFNCPCCGTSGDAYRFANRPTVLRCRHCQHNSYLTAGTVMERTHTPLSVWFWAAYLIASQTPGMSAVQFQRQLGLPRYETAFQILHKLRAGMVRPDQDRIGGNLGEHVEADETYVGGRTRGKGRGVHDVVLVAGAVEVKQRKHGGSLNQRRTGRYAGRVRLAVVPDRSAKSLGGFIERVVTPGATIITDDWRGYATLGRRGYLHTAIAERGDMQVVETFLPIIHLVFSNLKTWLRGIHHGVSPQHLQAYLNEFTFRFNRRFYPFNAFRSLLGIAGNVTAPTYAELDAKKSRPLQVVGLGTNRISTDTSIHWRGLLLPPGMDGVPGVSFAGIKAGDTFIYRFPVRQNGTYWYHSHSGFREQEGHYGPLIIDAAEPESFHYEREYVVLLSDWTSEDPMRMLVRLKQWDQVRDTRATASR